jgi:hypothetical protein
MAKERSNPVRSKMHATSTHKHTHVQRDRERDFTVNLGSRILYTSTSSIIRSYKLEKALSNTIPAIEGSPAPYRRLHYIIGKADS